MALSGAVVLKHTGEKTLVCGNEDVCTFNKNVSEFRLDALRKKQKVWNFLRDLRKRH